MSAVSVKKLAVTIETVQGIRNDDDFLSFYTVKKVGGKIDQIGSPSLLRKC